MSYSNEPQLPVTLGSLRQAPESSSSVFDECFSAPGEFRPHWQTLISSLNRLGGAELGVRVENKNRILSEHGVSCFVARERGGHEEPWQLDLMPLVIGQEEWRALEAGLIQRAWLLNGILRDLYGTQRLVRDGFVPAPLVFANPGYLRPSQAIVVKDDTYLQIYAVDLGRSPEGDWWVLADRTQAPTGLGFALENRSVLSRVLPEAVFDVQPRPVGDTLRIHREALRQFAPQTVDNPSIVLLTPGPRNEAYFEHAYLARLLGLTLVEGDDLTVRDRRLFIKTLDGLRRADVMLRRVSDAFCDPLELRGDSLLGVPGLVEAARGGRISIGNALGSGLLESPGFMPFLPGLCRHLLGEELRVPSLATWWCGQASEQSYVRDHLGELAVRPAFNLAGVPVKPEELTDSGRADLLEQLRIRPHEFVGQERIRLSRAPVGTNAAGASQPFVLRVFVLHDGQGFRVMPGGLARVVGEQRMSSFTLPLSGLSKDVWVLPDGEAFRAQVHIMSTPQPAMERAPSDLSSRTADNFFWLGRYAERLEQIVRVLRYVLRCLGDDSSLVSRGRLGPLERLLAELEFISAPPAGNNTRETLPKEILLLLFEEDRRFGVRDLIRRIHQAAFSVRDRLSADTWRIVNRLEPDARQRPGGLPFVQASATLHALVLDLAALSGMEMENMTRGHGWAFLDLGRRLERGAFVARVMDGVLRSGADLDLLLEPALEIGDSVMTHRRRYFAEPRLASTMEVMVWDTANPRSLAFQIKALENHAATLPTGANPEGVMAVKTRIRQLAERLGQFQESPSADLAPATNGTWQAELLTGFAAGLGELSDLVTQVYFSHVSPQVS